MARPPTAMWSSATEVGGFVQGKGMGELSTSEIRVEATGTGEHLPEEVRAKMEVSLGMDFSGVRIHVGTQAPSMGAVALTRGLDIFFAPGQYQPWSRRGQELLGHELTHVVQQSEGRVGASWQSFNKKILNQFSSARHRSAFRLGQKAGCPGHSSNGQVGVTVTGTSVSECLGA